MHGLWALGLGVGGFLVLGWDAGQGCGVLGIMG